ncbi:hypothetical protein ACFQ4K_22795 [Tistrella bauzanensis]
MTDSLSCVAGRREFLRDRYFIAAVATPDDVRSAFTGFTQALETRRTVAGLFVATAEDGGPLPPEPAVDAMRRMAGLMSVLTPTPASRLADGGQLNRRIRLRCPVTDRMLMFDDFDAVAFCPAAQNPADPLYDPMMAAPVVCANLNSDVYAFSMFTRDTCLQAHGVEVWDLPDAATRRQVFAHAAALWQRFAEKTIRNYIAITDTALCPTFMDGDHRHWYASHQDPAFAETRKELYRHDMPVLYTDRIIQRWIGLFDGAEAAHAFAAAAPSTLDLTPAGTFAGTMTADDMADAADAAASAGCPFAHSHPPPRSPRPEGCPMTLIDLTHPPDRPAGHALAPSWCRHAMPPAAPSRRRRCCA